MSSFIAENLTTLLSSIVEQIEGEKLVPNPNKRLPVEDVAEIGTHNAALDRAITIIKSSME